MRCEACGKPMPMDAFAYLTCGECWHVWYSEEEFLEHWRSTWRDLHLSTGDWQDLMSVKAEEIFACPCCSHDL